VLAELWESWLFFLPASLVSVTLYAVWLVFGQAGVLPLDLNRTWRDEPLVGGGRGLTGVVAAGIIAAGCAVLQGRGDDTLVLALGAQFGMVANSFVKRRLSIQRGQDSFPWDHVDFVLGASLAYTLQGGVLTLQRFLCGLLICGFLHWLIGGGLRPLLDPLRAKI
jgi:hypothetical protein